MCRLLHDGGNLLREDLRRRIFAVHLPIRLRALARLRDEHPEVRAHSRVHDADVGTDDGHLVYHRVVDEDGRGLLLGGDDDAIGRYMPSSARVHVHGNGYETRTLDPKTCRSRGDGSEGVFYLHELAARREDGERVATW